MKDNEITLVFHDAKTAQYVRFMCRRKGTNIPDYLIGNLEWDDKLPCILDEVIKKPNADTCEDCEYIDSCPDAVKPPPEAHR